MTDSPDLRTRILAAISSVPCERCRQRPDYKPSGCETHTCRQMYEQEADAVMDVLLQTPHTGDEPMTDHTDRSTEALLVRRELAEKATPGPIDDVLRLRAEVERLEKEADWLAATAANNGWYGERVSPEWIREAARKAVEKQTCPKN